MTPGSWQVTLTSQSLSDVSPEEKRPCESDSLRSMTSDLAHIDLRKIELYSAFITAKNSVATLLALATLEIAICWARKKRRKI